MNRAPRYLLLIALVMACAACSTADGGGDSPDTSVADPDAGLDAEAPLPDAALDAEVTPDASVTPPPPRLVSVNSGCNRADICIPAVEVNVGAEVVSFHIDGHSDPAGEDRKDLDTAISRAATLGRPVIFADDAGNISHTLMTELLGRVLSEAGGHYEHYDPLIGDPGMSSTPITGVQDFPAGSITALQHLGQFATPLTPGGVLTVSGTDLLWDGQPVTLVGYSWMGALVGLNFDITGYLDVLASHGVNLTRVWCVEQWTAASLGADYHNGLTPFAVDTDRGAAQIPLYDLTAPNEDFYDRLVAFVTAARDRGIVVQLTLFDRAGLRSTNNAGQWIDSPYNAANNVNGLLAMVAGDDYPAGFTQADGSPVGDANRAFVERTVTELSELGNVIFEVMNEPNPFWSNTAAWHGWITGLVHDAPY